MSELSLSAKVKQLQEHVIELEERIARLERVRKYKPWKQEDTQPWRTKTCPCCGKVRVIDPYSVRLNGCC